MRESDLYRPVRDYLEQRFCDLVRPRYGEFQPPISAETASGGGATGFWSKPDLCLFAIWRFKYTPGWHLDLHGFEVKTERACNTASVHEALNQVSQLHYAHLVWHCPSWADQDRRCREIHECCVRYGIGLITLSDPNNVDSFLVRVPAHRHEPAGDAIDEFIETRLKSDDRKKILGFLPEARS